MRASLCGLALLEMNKNGIHIGPKDTNENENDIFVKIETTHLKGIFYTQNRKLEMDRTSGSWIMEHADTIKNRSA